MDRTLRGEGCSLPGVVYSPDGLLLCERHAGEIESRERVVLLRGIVSTLDLCLTSLPVHRDVELAEALRLRRAEAAEELARTLQDKRMCGSRA